MVTLDFVNPAPSPMSKHGRLSSPISRLDFSLENLHLLSPPQSAKLSSPPESAFLLPEDETELFESCFFLGDDELDEVEMRSPVEERLAAPPGVKKSVKGGNKPVSGSSSFLSTQAESQSSGQLTDGLFPGSSSPFPISRRSGSHSMDLNSTLFKEEAGSEPVDIASPRRAGSKGSKTHKRSHKKLPSVRESLLAEAWERKRDHMLLSNMKEKTKPEQLGRSVSDCSDLPLVSPSEATKTKSRTRSLTDNDFDELRGCIDLGFDFTEDCIPDLCETLPALEVYYAVTRKLYDSPGCLSPVSTLHGVSGPQSPGSSSPSSTPSWRIASPGDRPQDVKARLRHWAQAVACTVRHSC